MSDDRSNKPGADEEKDAEKALLERFPAPPHIDHDVPAPPKIKVDLPPHPDKPRPGAVEPGSYKGTALAYQAASSFIMPIILLGLLGWFLDGRFHTGGIVIVVFFILGFVVGIFSLLRIVNQMDDSSSKRK
jgi:Putative F0F1-ATPase subunit Ca2+/Mg2+ transporter